MKSIVALWGVAALTFEGRKDICMSKYTLPSLLEMLKAGVHFGHQTSRWHPKMKPFIYTSRNDVHVINLEATQQLLERALTFLEQQTAAGGEVLFIGSKKQVKEIVKTAALAAQSPYVVEKWVGGTFTNFKTIFKLIKKLEKLEKQKEKGEWSRYTKKEQLDLEREFVTLQKKVGGIRQMSKLPAAVVVVDIKEEKTAIAEARKKSVPIVALCDSNVNPDLVDYPIPANDDAVRSVELIVNLASQAVKAGKEEYQKQSMKSADGKKSGTSQEIQTESKPVKSKTDRVDGEKSK